MASGSFNLTSSNTRVSIWCNWYEQNTSITNNTSEVVATVYLRRENNGYTTSGTMNTTVSLAGLSQTESGLKFSNSGTADTLLFAKTFTVSHNSDGSKSITISVSCSSDVVTGSGSQTVSLSTIARKSKGTLSSSTFNVGTDVTLNTNRNSSSFTHSLYIKYADGYYYNPVATNIGESCNINTDEINRIIYAQCPNSKSYSANFLLRTFNGSTAIGDYSDISFTANIPESGNKPTLDSNTFTQTNEATVALLGNNTGFVKNKSSLKVTFVDASAKNCASIKEYGIICGSKTYTSSSPEITLTDISETTLKCWVTDTRGFKSEENTITVSGLYDYFKPTISDNKITRGEIDAEKDYTDATLDFTIEIPEIIINKEAISLNYRYRKSDESTFGDYIAISAPDSTEKSYSLLLEHEFENNCSYIIEISATDAYGSYVLDEMLLQTANPELSIRKDRVGINCIPLKDNGSLQIDGINFIDYIHPVNSIYLSVSSQNPSQIFPGTTWSRIASGQALFGANDSVSGFTGGSTGGSSTHTHGRGNLSAAIGSCDSTPSTLGFIHCNELSMSAYGNATYCVSGASYKSGGSFNHFTKVLGTTGSASSLPPYMCVYMWKRTA